MPIATAASASRKGRCPDGPSSPCRWCSSRRRARWKTSLRLGAELALFADAGIVWSGSRDLAMRRARGGLGGGLRRLVPGSEMMRLDVGGSPEGGFRFHFANGTKPKAQRARR